FSLLAWLGAGLREALQAEHESTPVRCTVVVPGGPADAPVDPQISTGLVALEREGFEFLLFRVGREGETLTPPASARTGGSSASCTGPTSTRDGSSGSWRPSSAAAASPSRRRRTAATRS